VNFLGLPEDFFSMKLVNDNVNAPAHDQKAVETKAFLLCDFLYP